MDTKEYTMRELTDIELDEVAGGDPFGNSAVAVVTQALANTNNIVGQANGIVAGVIANTGVLIG